MGLNAILALEALALASSTTLPADCISTSQLAAGALAATASGRAVMAAGYFDEATFSGAVVDAAIVGGKAKAGFLAADATGRALVADNFFDEATFTSKVAAAAIVGSKAKAGFLSADAAGRALVADAFFDGATSTAKFVNASIPNNKFAKSLKVVNIAGGVAGDHTVTGITTEDVLAFVVYAAGQSPINTLGEIVSEFSITGANTINNAGGTDTSGGEMLVGYWG